jgi:hypothetical protein
VVTKAMDATTLKITALNPGSQAARRFDGRRESEAAGLMLPARRRSVRRA